jgi:hypothetical protein
MRKKAYVVVECDGRGCDSGGLQPLLQLTTREWGTSDFDNTLQRAGWKIGDDGDYCPECVKKRKVART